jgi:peptidyl-prolyl cis-trans isomerase SurA
MIQIRFLFFLTLVCCFNNLMGQAGIIDEIVAVVGDKKILYSNIEQNYMQLKEQGERVDENTRCAILEQMLAQKLLLNQSEVDSIEVTDSEVEGELDSRMSYFVNTFGSQEKLEEYFNKSIIEIKKDFRTDIRDMVLIRKMRNKITEGISVTPSEVRTYYKSLPQDSLPYINAEVEYNQILIYPQSSEQAIINVREKLLDIRERISNGESFATLAVIYSEDAGSAIKGGDIGWLAKSELDPDYAKAAFALKKGGISKIVETPIGFHLIQCVDRTEDRIHTRHILIRPKVGDDEKNLAIARLDSIVRLVRLDSAKFSTEAMLHSQDKDTRVSGGQAVNPMRGGIRWAMDEFEPTEYAIVNDLKVGEISDPYATLDNNGRIVFKIIWLKDRTNPHVGDLNSDYNLFKSKALQIKENEKVNEWVKEKIKTTYIRISPNFARCSFTTQDWFK